MDESQENKLEKLRHKALKRLNTDELKIPDLSNDEIKEMLQDIQVYQIELELQNEELMRTTKYLEETRSTLFSLYNRAPVGYIVLNERGIIVRENETFLRMIKRETNNYVGTPFHERMYDEDKSVFLARFRAFFKSPENKKIFVRLKKGDDDFFNARIEANPQNLNDSALFFSSGKKGNELLLTISDITEESESQRRIEILNNLLLAIKKINHLINRDLETDVLLSKIVEILVTSRKYNFAWIITTDENGDIKNVYSDGPEELKRKIAGFKEKKILPSCTKNSSTIYCSPKSDCEICNLKDLYESSCSLNTRLIYGNELFGYMGISFPKEVYGDEDEKLLIEELANDISHVLFSRIEREKRLQAEEKFRSVIEQSNDAISIIHDGKLDLVNKRFQDLTGITDDDIQKKRYDLLDFVDTEDHSLLDKTKLFNEDKNDAPRIIEFTLLNIDGRKYPVQASFSEIKFKDRKSLLGIIRDITVQKNLEEQLRHSQKIESIGQLVGGIAHDFNNLLTPIMVNSEFCMMDMDDNNPMFQDINEIHETAKKASNLTQQLLAFGRKQLLKVQTIYLDELIAKFKSIIRRTIREDITITYELNTLDKTVKVDVSQIEQILMNLVLNARDAMPGCGDITIKTEVEVINKKSASRFKDLGPGEYVLLSVSDNGEGMDKKVIDRIFDPFYTTKEVGKGTGLGLSTVYGIIKQHKGHITVSSKVGKGSTFKIYLPTDGNVTHPREKKKERKEIEKGKGIVLVVEDQDLVRKTTCRLLESQGYIVYCAANKDEAEKVFVEQEKQIDVLLTDVIMPDASGPDLYSHLIGKKRDLKVIYMSGYTKDVVLSQGIISEEVNFIQKPISINSLSTIMKNVLEKQ